MSMELALLASLVPGVVDMFIDKSPKDLNPTGTRLQNESMRKALRTPQRRPIDPMAFLLMQPAARNINPYLAQQMTMGNLPYVTSRHNIMEEQFRPFEQKNEYYARGTGLPELGSMMLGATKILYDKT